MLGLSSCHVTATGSLRCSELIIVTSISGGADAVKAIKGAVVTLQKQVGCFNHRVVTMVADKLERQWL